MCEIVYPGDKDTAGMVNQSNDVVLRFRLPGISSGASFDTGEIKYQTSANNLADDFVVETVARVFSDGNELAKTKAMQTFKANVIAQDPVEDLSANNDLDNALTDKSEKGAAEVALDDVRQVDPDITVSRITITSSDKPYLTGADSSFYAGFALTESSKPLIGGVFEIRFPAEFIQVGSVVPSDIQNMLSKEVVYPGGTGPSGYVNTSQDVVVRYYLVNLTGGVSVDTPIAYKTKTLVTPDGYKLPLTANLLLNEEVVATVADLDDFIIHPLALTKFIESPLPVTANNGTSLEGGSSDPDKPNFLSTNHADLKPIVHSFAVNQGSANSEIGKRYYEKVVIEDKIPAQAFFDPALNPGWTYDEATRTARIDYIPPAPGLEIRWGSTSKLPPRLTLLYPGADSRVLNTNTASATLTPANAKDYEPIKTVTDPITYYVIANKPFRPEYSISTEKTVKSPTVLDVESLKENYTTTFGMSISTNTNDVNAQYYNVVINDKVENKANNTNGFPSEMKITSINLTSSRSYYAAPEMKEKPIVSGTVNVYGYLQDGSEVLLAENVVVGVSTAKTNIPFTQDIYGVKVQTTAGSYLGPQATLTMELGAKFRNPADEHAPKSYINYADFPVNAPDGGKGNTRSASVSLVPVNRTHQISKSGGTGVKNVNNILPYTLNVVTQQIFTGEVIKDIRILDLLPYGVEYVQGTSYIVPKQTGGVFEFGFEPTFKAGYVEPQVIHNYNGTGRTALIWDIGDMTAKKDYTTTTYTYPLKINFNAKVTKFVEIGNNTNDSFIDIGNPDIFKPSPGSLRTDFADFNNNGDRTDSLSGSSTSFTYVPPFELNVKKEVKGNLDPGYVLTPGTGLAELGTEASFRLTLRNNSVVDYNHLTLVDLLPKIGDQTTGTDLSGTRPYRLSEFEVRLSGPIINSNPAKYTIYYTTDIPAENGDMKVFTTNANWVTNLADYKMATSFKIVMNDGYRFSVDEQAVFTFNFDVPFDKNLVHGNFTVNSFGVSVTADPQFTESNNSHLQIVRYTVDGYVFNDFDKSGVFDQARETVFANHKVQLLNADGTPALDPEGKPYETVTDEKGYYFMDVFHHGDYQIRVLTPDGYELTKVPTQTQNGPDIKQ